ncbi:hypothetical protein ACA910_022129 [Epithemia clementina (nom. ined.)]
MSNEGQVFAAAVDSEIAKFRALQDELKNLQNDLSIVLGQETENEMVMMELDLLAEPAGVFKLLGPILVPQDLDESKQTVQKRLEFIRGEKERLQKKISQIEHSGEELAKNISGMQANLQRTTVEAVRAIAAEHGRQ